MTERAVSDVIGFVLVFSLIALTVGIVYVGGIGGLEQRRNFEQVNNAEYAFTILADNVEDLRVHNAPSRTTEIDLSGAQLSMTKRTDVTVKITNLAPVPQYSTSLTPVVYSAEGGSQLIYENGAIIRQSPDGSAITRREPGLLLTKAGGSTSAIIPLVQTRVVGTTSVGGTTSVSVHTDLAVTEVLTARNTGPYQVSYTVATDSNWAPAWHRYLDKEIEEELSIADACSLSGGGIVTCTFTVDRLYVTATRVDVTLS